MMFRLRRKEPSSLTLELSKYSAHRFILNCAKGGKCFEFKMLDSSRAAGLAARAAWADGGKVADRAGVISVNGTMYVAVHPDDNDKPITYINHYWIKSVTEVDVAAMED